MRIIDLIFLLIPPTPVLAESTGAANNNVRSIFEAIGYILKASSALDDILQFLIYIAVIGIIAIVLHLWHKRTSVTLTLFALLILAVSVAAYLTHDARKELRSVAQSRLFLPLGESRRIGPFSIELTDVDTLKTKIKEGEVTPWAFNLSFGKDALKDFVELGRTRLQKDFIANEKVLDLWPKFDELIVMPSDNESSRAWRSLMKRLEVEVVNAKTERKVELKEAFSKWPLVRLKIRDARTDRIMVNRYFPDRSVIVLPDEKGTSHQLEIETVFNGDRDLDEAEACVLRLQKVSK